ncbi:hypothetical protein PSACC_00029 [Paramicrosporidium saccamoebae]|uniref:Uncharacterized protein n=1 Tax=Paramicrosporidium saccamoebae TaxID=1246581 RepID=A0A2H9TR55_9FUNG|nr:hypothetical protein PSACC_00029 [Paramicrosporidium saccamoebae]
MMDENILLTEENAFTEMSMVEDESKATNKSGKPRRMRKQPLMALGDRRVGTDLSRSDTSQRLLEVASMSTHAKLELYNRLSDDLRNFVSSASHDWQEGEECRRFTVFGDCITCARWNDQSLVSGVDIIKVIGAMYRLANMGGSPTDRRKFEEGITSDLRSLKVGAHAILEEAHSSLLDFLYRISSVRTHKRQKIFFWDTVPFEKLYHDAAERENRTSQSPERTLPRGRSNSYPFMNSPRGPLRGNMINAKRSYDGTESASPRSWGSPENSTDRSGYILYVPAAMRRHSAPADQPDITSLSMVADAALGMHDYSTHAQQEAVALPPIRTELKAQESPLPKLDSILPKELD